MKRVTIGHFAPRLPLIAASRQSNRQAGTGVSAGQPDVTEPIRIERAQRAETALLNCATTVLSAPASQPVLACWYTGIPSVNQEDVPGKNPALALRKTAQKTIIRNIDRTDSMSCVFGGWHGQKQGPEWCG
ncbi:hypothetical protein [Fuscibacter oryzae]|uniref:Uncharacterized protein n=1 Tax=Fuscibacter oryzae TaxID=2803939 RepID=A0A8J7MVN6_9RHOB|nr:hypothetical protein [Fuscibacter oryzae]MBL4928664.1 hypothetical protein [Fuscibacter oryzae]